MRLTFLGTGTSFGVPQIGCECPVCRSTDARDKRTRAGALVEVDDAAILIDTPPELRLQLVAAGRSRVDAVLYTHAHADHINGIDDLRVFSVKQGRPLPLYGPAETLATLRSSFNYIFDDNVRPYQGTSKPALELCPVEPGRPLMVAGIQVLPLAFQHGNLRVFGYRLGGLAYITDVKEVPPSARERPLVAAASYPPQHHRSRAHRAGSGCGAYLPHPSHPRDRPRGARGAAAGGHRPGV